MNIQKQTSLYTRKQGGKTTDPSTSCKLIPCSRTMEIYEVVQSSLYLNFVLSNHVAIFSKLQRSYFWGQKVVMEWIYASGDQQR